MQKWSRSYMYLGYLALQLLLILQVSARHQQSGLARLSESDRSALISEGLQLETQSLGAYT